MTKYEAAAERGIKVFDTALPQGWVDEVQRLTDVYPAPHFVWSYDPIFIDGVPRSNICGRPEPVSPEGDELLGKIPQYLSYRMP